jgi:hypothetical protein
LPSAVTAATKTGNVTTWQRGNDRARQQSHQGSKSTAQFSVIEETFARSTGRYPSEEERGREEKTEKTEKTAAIAGYSSNR